MVSGRSNLEQLPKQVREALAIDLTIDITTTGRKSGRPSRIEIWFLNVDDTIYITGTPGPRDWFANLSANPIFTFHLKESIGADLPGRAVVVDDPLERRRVIESVVAEWYRGQAPTEDLVDRAPMVRVEFAIGP